MAEHLGVKVGVGGGYPHGIDVEVREELEIPTDIQRVKSLMLSYNGHLEIV
jgi:hypothetical protein